MKALVQGLEGTWGSAGGFGAWEASGFGFKAWACGAESWASSWGLQGFRV